MQDISHGNSVAYEASLALDPAASVFVSANAGAGKTSLLVNRVLSLLLHGVSPSKILCLTFTNAAAAEMLSRIQEELGRWVMEDDEALRVTLQKLTGQAPDAKFIAHARSLFAQVLEAPEMRIQTLHSFCQSLLKRFPIEAGISPHFTVMDGRSEQALLKESRLRLFTRAQTEAPQLLQAIRAMAHDVSENSLKALLNEIIAHKRALRSLFTQPHGIEQAITRVWRTLQIEEGATLGNLIGRHFNYDTATLEKLRRICAQLSCGGDKEQNISTQMTLWLESHQRDGLYESYSLIFLTQKGEPRKSICAKGSLEAELMEVLKAEQERVWRFCDACKALNAALYTIRMLHVAEALLALYDAQKKHQGLMDYDDLILGACALLQRSGIAPWVLFKLDGGIDHILVDEAQDTSPEQWQIIDALTQEFFAGEGSAKRERSLFIVGDEKQSIYSFQGADVASLARMEAHFAKRIEAAGKTLRRVELVHSFRSAQQVLLAVDAVFAQLTARAGLVSGNKPIAHTVTRHEVPGLVELWPLMTPPEDSESGGAPSARLAAAIAENISNWLHHGTMLDSKNRSVEAGDIMILVKSRTRLVDALVRALKRRNVPVAGQDRMALKEHLAVQDLIALGQCVLLPEDDLTLAALLKSPIFNISEETLFKLAYNRGKESLWERLRQSNLPECKTAFALMTDLRAKADFISPYELYAWLLDTHGARKRFTGRMGQETHDPIDEFLGQTLVYQRSHPPSLQGFLHWLDASDSEIKRDMEQAGGSVRILTVHGAKGLQAPIVILPDTTLPPTMKDALLWHDEEGDRFPFWPVSSSGDDATLAGLRDGQKQSMLAEYRRLLYVAMTRAEDRLYICGASANDKLSEQSWYHLVRGGLQPLATSFEMPWGEGLRIGMPPKCHPERSEAESKDLLRSLALARDDKLNFLTRPAPAEPIPPRPLSPSRLPGDEPAVTSPLLDATLYQRGNLIHRLLQILSGVAKTSRATAAKNIAQAYAKTLSAEIIDNCISEANAILDDARFAFLFSKDSLAEAPVAGCVDVHGHPVAVSGQIDRLYVGEKEVWIVDFKSHQSPPEAIPLQYLRQLQLYRRLIQQIYPDKTVHCALLWTAGPTLVPLTYAQLDAVPASSYI